MRTPILEYFLSDTYGKSEPDPLKAEKDPDALLTTDLARLAHVLEHGTPAQIEHFHIHEKINTNGRPAVAAHIAKILVDWNERYRRLLKQLGIFTGLFVNEAPRDQGAGGEPAEFYIVETDNNARIVGTPLRSLEAIAPHAAHVWKIPNKNNDGLWENGTQFRSATAHQALDRDHRYRAVEVDPSVINASNALGELVVRYVDIYGNIVGYGGANTHQIASRLLECSKKTRRNIRIRMGGRTLDAKAANSLEDGAPGTLIAYPNGGDPQSPHIDIAKKGGVNENSAYVLCGRPEEEANTIHIDFMDDDPPQDSSIISTLKEAGAECVGHAPVWEDGPFGIARLAEAVKRRLKPGTGLRPGRPTDESWKHRPKVPMSQATVDELTVLANEISTSGRKVTPMQVAATLLREELRRYFDAP